MEVIKEGGKPGERARERATEDFSSAAESLAVGKVGHSGCVVCEILKAGLDLI